MSHNHKCMSCGESWECPIPSGCLAQADVLPSIVLKGPRGPQVFDHVCQRKTTPPEALDITRDAERYRALKWQQVFAYDADDAGHVAEEVDASADKVVEQYRILAFPSPLRRTAEPVRLCGCPGACQGYATLPKGVVCSMHVPESIARPPQSSASPTEEK